jgi:hypothetical protein
MNEEKPNHPNLEISVVVVGVFSFFPILIPHYWYDLFGTEGNFLLIQSLPIFLWGLCFAYVCKYRQKPLKKYRWMAISAILSSWYLLVTVFVLLGWTIGGFAP